MGQKAADRCKILFADRTGYCLLYKRLDAGTFHIPLSKDSTELRVAVDAGAFAPLLEGVAGEVGRTRKRRMLFELERALKGLSPAERQCRRVLESKAVVDAFAAWRNAALANLTVDPRAPFRKALAYTLWHWGALCQHVGAVGAPRPNAPEIPTWRRALAAPRRAPGAVATSARAAW